MKKGVASAIVLGTMFCLLAVSLNPVGAAAEWTPGVSIGIVSTRFWDNANNTVTAILYNDNAVAVDVYSINLSFDWAPSIGHEMCPSVTTVPAGENRSFSCIVYISGVYRDVHIGTEVVTAQAVGDAAPSNASYQFQCDVRGQQTLGVVTTASPSSGTAPMNVTFTTSVSGGVPGYTYFWTFGDGQNSTSANPVHRYAGEGSYTVNLVVTDSNQSHVEWQGSIKTGSATSGNDLPMILGALGAIVLIALVAFLFLRKRTRPKA
ncbi:MAG: PKD domain-containing protein [Methanomassiliicoccales archaeon]